MGWGGLLRALCSLDLGLRVHVSLALLVPADLARPRRLPALVVSPPCVPRRPAGGAVHLPGAYPQANLLLAFEYKGGWRDVHGAVVMTVGPTL